MSWKYNATITTGDKQMKTWKIALLLSYISIASASAAIITPALPQIQADLALSHGSLEWIINIFLIGYTFGQLFYGPLSNRIGRLNALRTGFIINLLGISLCLLGSYTCVYFLVLAGRFITALGAAAGLCCTFTLLNESLSAERAKHALSFAVVSFTAGIGLAVLLGGVMTQYLQWQDCFWVLLLHGILMLASINLFKETLTSQCTVSMTLLIKNYCNALFHKTLFTFSLLLGLVSLFSYCYSAAAPLIAQNKFHLSAAHYGYLNTVNMGGMLLGALAATKLLKRLSSKLILLTSTSLMTLAIIFLAYLTISQQLNTIIFFTITASIYFIASIIFPAASHAASNAISDKANASGAMNLINMSSAVIGVGIMGYLPISPLWGLIIVTLIFSCACLFAMIGVFLSNKLPSLRNF